jgi:predicted PurR-regulated permease PerM
MSLPPPTARQARIIWLALTGLSVAAMIVLVAGLVWGLSEVLQLLSPVLWPLAVAGVLAYLLDPVVDWMESRRFTRPRAIASVFAVATLVVLGLFASIVPQVVSESKQLIERVPAYAAKLQTRFEDLINNPPYLVKRLLQKEEPAAPTSSVSPAMQPPPEIGPAVTNAPPALNTALNKETLQGATSWLTKVLPKIGSWFFGQLGRLASWFGVLAGLALIPVYTFYFLLEKEGISSRWTDYLPMTDSRFKEELVFVLNSINNYLIAFFRGQVLVAISDGILYAIGFLCIGLPYAILLGVVASVLTMIPFLGAIITCSAALLIAIVQYGDWLHPILVLVIFAIVQSLEGLYISPKIMGGKVGLHPVTIIIAVMVGTTLLGGILGGILAIPLTAALRVVMFRYVWKRAATPAADA